MENVEHCVWCLECKDVWSTDTDAATVVVTISIIIIITYKTLYVLDMLYVFIHYLKHFLQR